MSTIETIGKNEARLLGVLIEKATTTPEHYPLTLNAAVNAANQKSNRNPVMALEEDEVLEALENLVDGNLAKRAFPGGSRVEKFAHSAGGKLGLNSAALAVLAELLLRGPQTVGELRTRARRMAPLESLDAVQQVIQQLFEARLCKRFPPEPGGRAERYAQVLSPHSQPSEAIAIAQAATQPTVVTAASTPPPPADLERRVEDLERRLAEIEGKLNNPTG